MMRKSPKFSPDVVERAVRIVFEAKDQYESQWAAIESIAAKIGCSAATLRIGYAMVNATWSSASRSDTTEQAHPALEREGSNCPTARS